jgi:hypothetical protein
VWRELGEFFSGLKAKATEVSPQMKEAARIAEGSHA